MERGDKGMAKGAGNAARSIEEWRPAKRGNVATRLL